MIAFGDFWYSMPDKQYTLRNIKGNVIYSSMIDLTGFLIQDSGL